MKRSLLLVVVVGLASAATGQTQHALGLTDADVQAKQITFDGNVYHLEDVTVVIAENRLSADAGTFNPRTLEVQLSGNVRLVPPPGSHPRIGTPPVGPPRLRPATRP
jgi:hypothetical protein